MLIEHQSNLRAFVLSLMGGSVESEDVIQEINITIWRKRDQYQQGTKFLSWMLAVAKFRVMAHWRDSKRKKEWTMPEDILESLAGEVEEYCGSTSSQIQMLKCCLQNLRPSDRSLVLRRYLKGMSLNDLSREVDRTADSLKVSLHRIRGLLRSCIRGKMAILENQS